MTRTHVPFTDGPINTRRPMLRHLPNRPLSAAGPIMCVLSVVVAAFLRIVYFRIPALPDADVYAAGGRSLMTGQPLYETLVHGLRFTYPPFAAVLFAPIAVLPKPVMQVLVTVVSLASYALGVLVFGRRLHLSRVGLAFLLAAGLVTEPLSRTLVLGQVNLLMLALVLLDVLVLPRRWQGILIGIAAGIKITPGVFVVYYLLRREWASALRAGATALATVAVGFLLAPHDSWAFWSGGFMGTERFGPAAGLAADNQSLVAVVMRVARITSAPAWLTYSLCALCVAAAAIVAARLLRRRDDLGAVVALGVGGLLGSPISWTHHWIWVIPAFGLLAARGRWWSALALGVTLIAGPMWVLDVRTPYASLHYSWVEQLLASAYVLAAVFLLIVLWFEGRRDSPGGVETKHHSRAVEPEPVLAH